MSTAEKKAAREGYLNENYHYFHLHDTAGQERSFHYHDFDKIVVMVSGKVDYTVEDVTYPLSPGNILLIRNHSIHRALIDVSEPYDRVIIYLDPDFFEKTFPAARLTECFETAERSGNCLLLPDKTTYAELNQILQSYETAAEDRRTGADAMRDTYLAQMMILINRISAEGETAGAGTSALYDEKITKAVTYINEHFSEEISVESLAAEVYLSKYHFMRLFKAQTGETVHAYIRQKRLLYAARLIRGGTPAIEAARESGFADYSTFSRAFRDSFGIRPGDLKQK